MASVGEKAAYVRSAARSSDRFNHHCHWTGCERQVPPAMWGCKQHWFKLPAQLRARIWKTYRPGQEVTKTPSADYLVVAREVQDWIAAQGIEAATAGETACGLDGNRESPVANGDAPNPNPNPTTGG